MPEIYLDHAASTTVRPAAIAALRRWLEEETANASSPHGAGRSLRVAVEDAREQVAAAINASPHDIVFTSGGTEADNLAVKGIVWARLAEGRRHLVTTAVEHAAVLEPARWLAEHDGVELTVVAPGPDGRVDVERVLDAVRDDTALVSVMAANNEIGAINDIPALGEALRAHGVPLHTDAVQAFATLAVDVDAWNLDAMSLSAHKFGGPQGVGIAYLRRGVGVVPLLHGGGQDRGVRSGTFAAALDAACGVAVAEAVTERPDLRPRLRRLSKELAAGLTANDGVRRNGPENPAWQLPSHVHVSVDGVDAEALTLALDRAGLHVSGGAACGSGAAKTSHVLEATGITGDAALRFSLGWPTTDEDVAGAVEVFSSTLADVRAGR